MCLRRLGKKLPNCVRHRGRAALKRRVRRPEGFSPRGWAGRNLYKNTQMANSLQTVTSTPAQYVTPSCWSCGAMRASHFCNACGKVQPAAPVDYFTFFGLPRKLNVDVAALEKDFYLLSRKLHPDVVAQGSRSEQEWSLQQSSSLNDAYRTLKDPVRRTEYLLRIEGVELE